MHRFQDKVALITGGARGMGEGYARRLSAEGARVVITDILETEGSVVASQLGPTAMFIHHDVADEEGWRAVMREVTVFAGGLDYLVNNAGVARFQPIGETSLETFKLHQSVNELGVFLGMKHAAPLMIQRGGGAIVNVSSLGGMRVGGNDLAYVGSKWAVRGMTKAAAKEYGPRAIRVNSIHPGLVKTPMLGEVPDSVIEKRAALVPLKRAGTLEDMSNLVAFLLSDEASYITGAEIVIDGGLGL